MSFVDPSDLGLLPTFRRLLRLWRVQWRLGVFGLACSLAYTLISTAIPVLIQQAIDRSIVHHAQPLWPYLAIIDDTSATREADELCSTRAMYRIMQAPRSRGLVPAIGETGFEPATARPPAGCATRLRYSP